MIEIIIFYCRFRTQLLQLFYLRFFKGFYIEILYIKSIESEIFKALVTLNWLVQGPNRTFEKPGTEGLILSYVQKKEVPYLYKEVTGTRLADKPYQYSFRTQNIIFYASIPTKNNNNRF